MNYSTAIFLFNDNARAVLATYEATENAPKTMFKTLDRSIKVGDFIVVPTDTRHKMTVCKVTDVDVQVDVESPTIIAWAVGKVEAATHESLLGMERKAVEMIQAAQAKKKRDELRQTLLDAAPELGTVLSLGSAVPPATPS